MPGHSRNTTAKKDRFSEMREDLGLERKVKGQNENVWDGISRISVSVEHRKHNNIHWKAHLAEEMASRRRGISDIKEATVRSYLQTSVMYQSQAGRWTLSKCREI